MVRFGSYRFEKVSRVAKGLTNIFVETPLPDKKIADRQVLGGLGWKVLLEGILRGTSRGTLEEKREELLKFTTLIRYFSFDDESVIFKARLINPTFGKRIGFSFEKRYSLQIVQVDLANFVEGDFERDDNEDGISNGWEKHEEIGNPDYAYYQGYEGERSQVILCLDDENGGLASPLKKVLGTNYFISGQLYKPCPTGVGKLALKWYDADKVFISESVVWEGTFLDTWTLYELEPSAPTNARYWRTVFTLNNQGETGLADFYVDEVITRWKDYPT